MSKAHVLQVDAGGQQVVLVATADGSTARAFLAGRDVFAGLSTNEGGVRMRDDATGSVWDGFEGRALSGTRGGETLERIQSHLSYWFSWRSFFPDTTVLGHAKPGLE